MLTDSEYLRETSFEEILSQFPCDLKTKEMHTLFYKNKEIFMDDEYADPYQNPKQPLNSDELNNTLRFWCYCQEEGLDDEIHRIRIYMLSYHLDDDTLSLNEPQRDNIETTQARVFSHQKVPLSQRFGTAFLHWKNLNTGVNILIFGTKYRITSCSKSTKKHGVKLNTEEPLPSNPWMLKNKTTLKDREQMSKYHLCPSILSFRCYWYDYFNNFRSHPMKRIFKMLVFPSDHTVSLVEETKEFEGQLFLKRIHVPRASNNNGTRHYYYSWDFRPGIWVRIFSRDMFISDCIGDETKQYLALQCKKNYSAHNNGKVMEQGSSSIKSSNAPHQLTFLCHMVNPSASLFGIKFLLIYNMNTQQIKILESDKRRKWIAGRQFLPYTDAKMFSERHFVPGQILQLFQWKFYLIEGDEITTEYLKENS